MIITNLKLFNNVCKEMQKFCKHKEDLDGYKEERLFHNVFFMDKNIMCATNGKFMALRNMSDCVMNYEEFAFPCNLKPTKFVTKYGDKFVIENKKEEFFTNDKKEVIHLNWKKIIPTDKPRVSKEYNFSDYKITNIPLEKYSNVKFCNNGDVVFNYKDYCETKVTYSDVQITKDDFFDSVNDIQIKNVKFPMHQIYWVLSNNKNFIYQEYDIDGYTPRMIVTNRYKFILNPMCDEEEDYE